MRTLMPLLACLAGTVRNLLYGCMLKEIMAMQQLAYKL